MAIVQAAITLPWTRIRTPPPCPHPTQWSRWSFNDICGDWTACSVSAHLSTSMSYPLHPQHTPIPQTFLVFLSHFKLIPPGVPGCTPSSDATLTPILLPYAVFTHASVLMCEHSLTSHRLNLLLHSLLAMEPDFSIPKMAKSESSCLPCYSK